MQAARPGAERPDEEILSDILYSLRCDSRIDASGICVSVRNGIVCLSGQVDCRTTCRILSSIAHRTPGIVDVHDGILAEEYED